MILKVPGIPKPGETIMSGTFNTAPGGKGANQAVTLSENHSLTDAVCFANTAAALSVTRFGAQPSIPFRSQVDEFIKHIQKGVNNGKTTK